MIIVIVMIFIGGCSRDENIKIGVVGTMTGPSSDLAVSGRRGVELAVKETNDSGGIDGRLVELVIKDDKNNSLEALTTVEDLIEEQVQFVIGHYTSGMMVETIEQVNENSILYLSPTVSADSLSDRDDNFIRFIADTKAQAIQIVKQANKSSYETFMIVYDHNNEGFNSAMVNNVVNEIVLRNNNDVTVVGYQPNNAESFDLTVKEIQRVNPDGLFIICGAEDTAKIVRRITQVGLEAQMYGPLWANTEQLILKGGIAIEGMILVGTIDETKETDQFTDFKKKYSAMFGEQPTFSSLYSYEATVTLIDALLNTTNDDIGTIKDYIISKNEYSGLQEPFIINAYGDCSREYKLFVIKNGIRERLSYD